MGPDSRQTKYSFWTKVIFFQSISVSLSYIIKRWRKKDFGLHHLFSCKMWNIFSNDAEWVGTIPRSFAELPRSSLLLPVCRIAWTEFMSLNHPWILRINLRDSDAFLRYSVGFHLLRFCWRFQPLKGNVRFLTNIRLWLSVLEMFFF